MSRESQTAEGVRAAWDFWLSQHDVSVPMIVEAAVQEAVRGWMDAHGAQIVAQAVRETLAVSLAPSEARGAAEQEHKGEASGG